MSENTENENKPFEPLPLMIHVKGEVVSDNLDAFVECVNGWLAKVKKDLQTDEDFGQAEIDVKAMKAIETTVSESLEAALNEAKQVRELLSKAGDAAESVRKSRLALERQIKDQKEKVKAGIIADALASIERKARCSLNIGAGYNGKLSDAAKSKRTVASLRQAVDAARIEIEANIDCCSVILANFEEEHGKALIMDAAELVHQNDQILIAELRRRVELHEADQKRKEAEAKLKAEEDRRKAEESAKAEAEKKAADPLPQVPTQHASATRIGEPNEAAEWAEFTVAVKEAFEPLKGARKKLTHPENIDRAAKFAAAVGNAWNNA